MFHFVRTSLNDNLKLIIDFDSLNYIYMYIQLSTHVELLPSSLYVCWLVDLNCIRAHKCLHKYIQK